MARKFNVTGLCIPSMHYMVDISEKVQRIIEEYIEPGEYFTINRARQFGKTTTLECLYQALRSQYLVLDLSFEGREEYFASFDSFAQGISMDLEERLEREQADLADVFSQPVRAGFSMRELSKRISTLCAKSEKEVLLFIDEVDKAASYQVFLAFLGLLRDKYLEQKKGRGATFKSVILAGVHDIKNLKAKIRSEEAHTYNSPWNVAADFKVDMSFSVSEISQMLWEYEMDYHTGMDAEEVAKEIFFHTSGYPFLVSALCKQMHEGGLPFSPAGVIAASKQLMKENNTLFDDIIKNLQRYPDFQEMLERMLLQDEGVSYARYNPRVERGVVYGILKEKDGRACVSNIIFETVIYDYLISLAEESQVKLVTDESRFVQGGKLILEETVDGVCVKETIYFVSGEGGVSEKPYGEFVDRRDFGAGKRDL